MYIDGDRLVVSIDLDLSEVQELAQFVKDRMDFIEGVDLENTKPNLFGSSALFALLASMKVSKPALDIPLFNPDGFDVGAMGIMHWEVAWTKNV
ncbi:MAG: hypothetical protein LBN32_00625 [Helicobacteraceae bacterium]|jgi:hypothetical protein|nr:hypothetical protein [Helicobacteraceae bacterium]